MLRLLRVIDKANGYVHLPGQSTDINIPDLDSMPGLDELGTIDDVQERWGPNKEVYDREQDEEWEKEWQIRGARDLGPAATVIRPDAEARRHREQDR